MIQQSDMEHKLGRGSYKSVYSSRIDKDIVYAIVHSCDLSFGKNLLLKEKSVLDILKSYELPVASYISFDEIEINELNDRMFCKKGKYAVGIMNRYLCGMKDIYLLDSKDCACNTDGQDDYSKFINVFNERTIESCNIIINNLIKHNISINDMQFLIKSSGEMVISDPLGIYSRYSNSDYDIEYLKRVILACRYCIAIRKDRSIFNRKLDFWGQVDLFNNN